MKNIILIILAIAPVFVSAQVQQSNNGINWVSLEEAKILAKKYNENILIFFYKKNCPYCDKMKKETLSDPTVIDIINRNFFAVNIDSRTKDTIIYNGKAYGNQQPASSGRYDWRHDFYAEVAAFNKNGTAQITTPTIVLFDSKFNKTTTMPGNQPKELLLRNLKKILK